MIDTSFFLDFFFVKKRAKGEISDQVHRFFFTGLAILGVNPVPTRYPKTRLFFEKKRQPHEMQPVNFSKKYRVAR